MTNTDSRRGLRHVGQAGAVARPSATAPANTVGSRLVAIRVNGDGSVHAVSADGCVVHVAWNGPSGATPGTAYFVRHGVDLNGNPSVLFEPDQAAAAHFAEGAGHG